MSDTPPRTTTTPTGDDHDPAGDPDAPVAPTEAALLAEREGVAVVGRSFGRQTWDRFRRHRLAIVATVVLALLALSFWVGPVFSNWDPLTPDTGAFRQGPSLEHPFGTDPIGRDLMVRTFVGGRFSLRIALFVALLTTAIGTVLGATAGYIGGIVDTLIDQLTNLFLQYKEQEFVLAAKAAGARAPRIMFRHILPNTFGPIVVNATLLIGTAIILESTLSFLGVGVQAPTPTLGNLIFESKGYIESKPSAVFIPGGFIVAITLCVNFLGDGLRDALDPTTRRS